MKWSCRSMSVRSILAKIQPVCGRIGKQKVHFCIWHRSRWKKLIRILKKSSIQRFLLIWLVVQLRIYTFILQMIWFDFTWLGFPNYFYSWGSRFVESQNVPGSWRRNFVGSVIGVIIKKISSKCLYKRSWKWNRVWPPRKPQTLVFHEPCCFQST